MISRRYQRIILTCIVFWIGFYFLHDFLPWYPGESSHVSPVDTPGHEATQEHGNENQENAETQIEEKELVVASMKGDDTSWLDQHFASWKKNIYTVNDPSAPLTVPKNKGREAMPFLTYIITRYPTLPHTSIFIHSLRYQWHNEDPMYDGIPPLTHLNLSRVQARGYHSLRCTWTMGCPAELHPTSPSSDNDDRSQNERAWASVFSTFFPDTPVPEKVGAHCSSQFAVSRARIHALPLEKYVQIRDWLLSTPLPDQISGRVLEYMWHFIFGMGAVDCEDAGTCFCEGFGLCGLKCSERECEKRYVLPQFATIPNGWPEVGPGENGWPAKGWAD